MATYVERVWAPGRDSLLPNRDRKASKYLAYIPDDLPETLAPFSPGTQSVANSALQALVRADERIARSGPFFNNLLIRSESISSSWIEGNRISVKKLAIAEALKSGSQVAIAVLANVRATEKALEVFATSAHSITVDDILDLHHTVEPSLERGIRKVQNFVGGTGWSPLRADFVPPPETEVERLLENLVAFLNATDGNPLIRAAVAHAQFETIHPFEDGNGRTGRALIHAILKRNGILQKSLIPISTVFSNTTNSYIQGLTAFRRDAIGIEEWVVAFCEAAIVAAESAVEFADDLADLERIQRDKLLANRSSQGKSPVEPRKNSLVLKLLGDLISNPVVTTESVANKFEVSRQAAHLALTELSEASILHISKDQKGRQQCYTADDILKLIQLSENTIKGTKK
jgi:Fic family protein